MHHNRIAQFVSDAIRLCTSRGAYFVLEQPSGSLLFDFQPIHETLIACRARQLSVQLYNFGHDSEKPLTLWGNAPWLEDLAQESARLSRLVNHKNDALPLLMIRAVLQANLGLSMRVLCTRLDSPKLWHASMPISSIELKMHHSLVDL